MIAGTLEIQLLANMARLAQDMAQAKASVTGAMSGIEKAVSSAKHALAGLGVGVSIAGFAAIVKGAIDAADHLNKLSQRVGVAVESLSALQYAGKLADVSNEDLAKGLKKLSVNIAETARGTGEAQDAFKALGISVHAEGGRIKTADQIVKEIATRFERASDGIGKTTVATKLFGKSGDVWIPMLNEGAVGLKRMADEAQSLGLIISADLAKKAEIFNDNLTRLKSSATALGIALATDLVEPMNNVVKAMIQAKKESGALMALWVGLGGVFAEFVMAHDAALTVELLDDRIAALTTSIAKLEKEKGTKQGWLNDLVGGTKAEQLEQQVALLKQLTTQREALIEAQKRGVVVKKEEAKEEIKYDGTATATLAKYEAMAKALREKTSLEHAELDALRPLTDGEKFAAKFMGDWVVATKDFTNEQRKKLALMLEDYLLTEQSRLANDRYTKAIKAHNDESIDKVVALEKENKTMREANQQIGLTDAQLLELNVTRNNATIALNNQAIAQLRLEDAGAAEILILEEQNRLLGERNGLLVDADVATRAAEEIKAQGEIWKSVDDVAKQTFVSIFQSGKSAFDRLKDALKNGLYALLYQMTVQKWIIQATVSLAGVGAATSAFGASAVGSAVGSGVGSAVGATAGSMIAANAAQAMGGDGIATLIAANAESWGVASAAGTGITGMVSTVLSAIPVVGWIALAVMAAWAMFGGKGGGPKTEGVTSFGGYTDAGYTHGANDPVTDKLLLGIGTTYNQYASLLGGKAGKFGGQAFISADPQGTALTQLQIAASIDGKSVYDRRAGGQYENVGRSDAELQAAIEQSTREALLGALKATKFDAATTAFIDAIEPTVESFKKLTDYMTAVAAQKGLIETLKTETEKLADAQKALADANLPNTIDAFRAMAAGLDLTTEAGQATLASMTNLRGALQLVTEAANASAANLQAARLDVKAALASISDQIREFGKRVIEAEKAVTASQNAISAAYFDAQDTVSNMLKQAAADLDKFTKSIDDFLATLTPSQSLGSLKALLSTTAVLAKGGDVDAQGSIINIAKSVLKSAEATSTSRSDYLRSEGFVRATLESVKAKLTPEVSSAKTAAQDFDEALAAARLRVVDLGLIMEAVGLSTTRTTEAQISGIELLDNYNAAIAEANTAQTDWTTAMKLTTGLTLQSSVSMATLIVSLGELGRANSAVTAAGGDTATALGLTSAEAALLATQLGLTGAEATAFATAATAAGDKFVLTSTQAETLTTALGLSGTQATAFTATLLGADTKLGVATLKAELLGTQLGLTGTSLLTFTQTFTANVGGMSGSMAAFISYVNGLIGQIRTPVAPPATDTWNGDIYRGSDRTVINRSAETVTNPAGQVATYAALKSVTESALSSVARGEWNMPALATAIINNAKQLRVSPSSLNTVLSELGYSGIDSHATAEALGIKGFASGGLHRGGWRVVGERGPELEYTSPSQIVNAAESRRMLSQDAGASTADEIAALRRDFVAVQRATKDTADILSRLSPKGDRIQVEVAVP